jgi:hypothetical protein
MNNDDTSNEPPHDTEEGEALDEASGDRGASARAESRSADERAPKRAKQGKARSSQNRTNPKAAASGLPPRTLVGVVALAAGGLAGWFGHQQAAAAKLRAESAPAAAGSAAASAGPCGSWQQKICSGSGEQSAACAQAKGAADLLTPSTCETALVNLPATLAKVKADRAPCDNLVSKLCAALPPGSAACTLVKERTPSFPHARCSEMLSHYDEVLQELKQMDQAGMGMQPGLPPGAQPPGAQPPGAQPPH